MNFLAHLYLSKSNQNVLLGNFIANAVKGKHFSQFNAEIQKGITLHRKIDYYTDNHYITKKSKARLHPRYNHYKGVIIDIFYDHFLAKNWHFYSQIPLAIYAENVYNLLLENFEILPKRNQKLLPYLIKYNWLVNYATVEGIEIVLLGMNNRTKGISKMDMAIEDLQNNYSYFEQDFKIFFNDLQQFTTEKTTLLLNK